MIIMIIMIIMIMMMMMIIIIIIIVIIIIIIIIIWKMSFYLGYVQSSCRESSRNLWQQEGALLVC